MAPATAGVPTRNARTGPRAGLAGIERGNGMGTLDSSGSGRKQPLLPEGACGSAKHFLPSFFARRKRVIPPFAGGKNTAADRTANRKTRGIPSAWPGKAETQAAPRILKAEQQSAKANNREDHPFPVYEARPENRLQLNEGASPFEHTGRRRIQQLVRWSFHQGNHQRGMAPGREAPVSPTTQPFRKGGAVASGSLTG